jgi:hypothetical protein
MFPTLSCANTSAFGLTQLPGYCRPVIFNEQLATYEQRTAGRGEVLVSELRVRSSVEVEEQAVTIYLANCILLC